MRRTLDAPRVTERTSPTASNHALFATARQLYWNEPEGAGDGGDVGDGEVASGSGAADDAAASWPLVLDLWSALDYELAPLSVMITLEAHGERAVDEVFRSPPRTDEQFVDPIAMEVGDDPVRVRLPAFADGERPRGPASDWGAYSWYLLLSSRIPWQDALAAAEGWGGDRYRSYTRHVGGTRVQCVRLAVAGETARDSDELQAAVAAWAAAMPAGAASSGREGDVVTLSACPTADVPTSPDDDLDLAFERLWARNRQLLDAVQETGQPPHELMRCLATGIVSDDELVALMDVERPFSDDEEDLIGRRSREILASCV